MPTPREKESAKIEISEGKPAKIRDLRHRRRRPTKRRGERRPQALISWLPYSYFTRKRESELEEGTHTGTETDAPHGS